MSKKLAIVILAAGKGTRLKSGKAKALHELAGQPLINHVLKLSLSLNPDYLGVVLGHQEEAVKETIKNDKVDFLCQREQLGTGHALMQAEHSLKEFRGDILVFYTDMPLLSKETITNLLQEHHKTDSVATVLTADLNNPQGYGRIIRQKNGNLLQSIIEDKDLPPDLRGCKEINTGTYVFKAPDIFYALKDIKNDNAQGEYYLTDVISVWQKIGKPVSAFKLDDSVEAKGISDQADLAEAEAILRQKIIEKHMASGVKIIDPHNTYIELDVEIAPDAIIQPGSFLLGSSKVGPDSIIGPYTSLINSQVGANSKVLFTYCLDAVIGDNCKVGPYAHLRPGTVLKGETKIGNFVEVKQSTVGSGSKIPHLSYVGDATIGKDCNIGAGTIFANYDGQKKNHTELDEGVFIGSNTTLVGPIKVGARAKTGAGAVVTKDVESGTTVVGVPAKPMPDTNKDK